MCVWRVRGCVWYVESEGCEFAVWAVHVSTRVCVCVSVHVYVCMRKLRGTSMLCPEH